MCDNNYKNNNGKAQRLVPIAMSTLGVVESECIPGCCHLANSALT